TIERMAGHWRNLLTGMCRDVNQRIADLPLLSVDERQDTLRDWNRDLAVYPSEYCAHQRIETQAGRTPLAIALNFGAEQLSYQ
ncbi:Pyoverdine sidechain peptide synthetase III, L-Thr-L-Ser component, partial [Pseudomonas amygdali pv. photiniae]